MASGNVGLDSRSTRIGSMFDDLISSPSEKKRLRRRFPRLLSTGRILLSIILLFVTGLIAMPESPAQGNAPSLATRTAPVGEGLVPTPTHTPSPPSSSTSTPIPSPQDPSYIPRSPTPPILSPLNQGLLILSISEAGYSHLYAYQPLSMPFVRLTYGAWDDITPALSPDGKYLAYASNRAGSWDLYMMDLASGENTRLTDTSEYDTSPSWSPDGHYLAYESYSENLEVLLKPVFDHAEPIPLGEHPAADFSPTWSPGGRQIAFISDRTGEREVWLADLDKVDADRLINLSQSPASSEAHPTWSPDGKRLAWASESEGAQNLYVWDQEAGRQYLGSGSWPTWSPGGNALFTTLSDPNQAYLTAYHFPNPVLAFPPLAMSGEINGITWQEVSLPDPLPGPLAAAARSTPSSLGQAALSPPEDVPGGRQRLMPLEGVQAPYPQLHDMVDEAFLALRERTGTETGWDFLSVLENAFVPLTAPLSPGMGEDWLYTGRGIAFNPAPLNAGWMAIIAEQFGGETYWRVYLRARLQDGSQGKPLFDRPWDFATRYNGDPIYYEKGGTLVSDIPSGYWIDFTALAAGFNWHRLPALSTWRSAYQAARFNEFVLLEGQDWRTAMLELYPPEALVTPTVAAPPTLTPTPSPRWTASP